jgi:hypothetical protein
MGQIPFGTPRFRSRQAVSKDALAIGDAGVNDTLAAEIARTAVCGLLSPVFIGVDVSARRSIDVQTDCSMQYTCHVLVF